MLWEGKPALAWQPVSFYLFAETRVQSSETIWQRQASMLPSNCTESLCKTTNVGDEIMAGNELGKKVRATSRPFACKRREFFFFPIWEKIDWITVGRLRQQSSKVFGISYTGTTWYILVSRTDINGRQNRSRNSLLVKINEQHENSEGIQRCEPWRMTTLRETNPVLRRIV